LKQVRGKKMLKDE